MKLNRMKHRLKHLQTQITSSKLWKKLRPHPLLPWWRRWLQWIAVGILAGAVSGFTLLILILLIFSQGLPDISKGDSLLQAQSTLILDREGNLLYAIHGEENREIIELDDISQYMVDATVAIEDDQFYEHHGFDLPCLAKAVAHETFGIGQRRGCSTITQQLVKNIFLTPEQTYKRKIQELILAIKVENRYEKNNILQMYLNEIPYGNNAYGAQLAAQRYFNKDASELTLAESAILAGIPQAPTYYSPYGDQAHSYLTKEFTAEELASRPITDISDLEDEEYILGLVGANIELADGNTVYLPGRADVVLSSMRNQGFITETQYDDALATTWTIEFQSYADSIKHPHFVLYVKQLLEDQYGTDVVEQGGLKVYTTLDPNLQVMAEEAVEKYRERNLTQFDATNASLVSIQPQTGQILAMVGSADYWDDEIDGNVNIATRYRAPGSSFKPFIYALAFLNGYAPASVVYDVETNFGGLFPQNYDGTFMGPMSMREGLALSRNIPAIKAYFLGGEEEKVLEFMANLGIEFPEIEGGYGWPIALGSGEVRLVDLVGAYTAFANQGVKQEITPILKVENSLGEVLDQWEDAPGEEVIDPQVAYLITDVLSDPNINLGARLRVSGYDVAAKTGTSNTKNDQGVNVPNNALTLGYSPNLTTGVWVGNADGSEMYYTANGYDTAATIWNDYMTNALPTLPKESFTEPEGITTKTVTTSSGLLPGANTPEDMLVTEIFASFNIPTEVDDRFVNVVVDKMTGKIATEYSPAWSLQEKAVLIHRSIEPAYTTWQAGIDAWIINEEIDTVPTEEDDFHTAEMKEDSPTISITQPSMYSHVNTGFIDVEVDALAPNGATKVEFYLNDVLQFTATSSPYSGSVRINAGASPGTIYEITAYIYDEYGYRGSSTIEVQVKGGSSSSSDESEDASSSSDTASSEDAVVEENDVEEVVDSIL
jgi:penicillin-binding protein 1A